MLASRSGRVIGAAVAVAALVTAWLVTGPMLARELGRAINARARRPGVGSAAANAVRAVLAGPRRELETHALPAPDYARDIGTPHPIWVRAVASNGRWLVACQARRDTDGKHGISVWIDTDSLGGDEMEPYLIRGGGAGAAIDGFVTKSPDDRWIVVLQDNQLVLFDDAQGTRSVLADAELQTVDDDIEELAAFSEDSQRLIYLRAGRDARTIVVRDLALQRERDIAAPDHVVGVTPEPNSAWARVYFPSAARDGSLDSVVPLGERPRPSTVASTPIAWRRPLDPARSKYATCNMPSIWHDRDGAVAWLSLETGALAMSPEVLAHVDGLEIVRRADRSITVSAAGTVGAGPIVPASCDGELETVFAHPLRVIATCRSSAKDAPFEMFGPGLHVVLTGTRGVYRSAARSSSRSAFCVMQACFALGDGHRIALPGFAMTVEGTRVLSKEHHRFFVTDLTTERTTPIAGAMDFERKNGSIIAFGTTIYDLAQGRVLGEVPRRPRLLDHRGRALIATEGHAPPTTDMYIESGPLCWATPRPKP